MTRHNPALSWRRHGKGCYPTFQPMSWWHQLLCCQMCLDVIPTNVFGPISSFLDQGACKNALLPQLVGGLEDTEATVQDDHIPLVEYGGEHLKQQSNSGTYVVKFLLPKSSGMILALHKIYPPHDRGTATDHVWLTGDEWRQSASCSSRCPDKEGHHGRH